MITDAHNGACTPTNVNLHVLKTATHALADLFARCLRSESDVGGPEQVLLDLMMVQKADGLHGEGRRAHRLGGKPPPLFHQN